MKTAEVLVGKQTKKKRACYKLQLQIGKILQQFELKASKIVCQDLRLWEGHEIDA